MSVVLLVSAGLSIPSARIAAVVKKAASSRPPRLVSMIQFDPDDPARFVTEASVVEQCRFAIVQLTSESPPGSPRPGAEGPPSEPEQRSSCRIVWIAEGCDRCDSEAVTALFVVAAREFAVKSLSVLRDGPDWAAFARLEAFCLASLTTLDAVRAPAWAASDAA